LNERRCGVLLMKMTNDEWEDDLDGGR
jgi:hypothetical protein